MNPLRFTRRNLLRGSLAATAAFPLLESRRVEGQSAASPTRLVVFTPQDKAYFCVEPVSHVSNAIHMADPAAHGLRSIAPGESFEAMMKLDIAVV